MIRTLVRIDQAVSHNRPVVDSRCLKPSYCIRTVSTNSAIHRGIRRSRHGEGRGARPALYGEADERRAGAVSREGDIRRTRVRKPNHQSMQDVEEMESMVNTRVERMTPQQRRNRMGGSTPSSTAPIQSGAQPYKRRASSNRTRSNGAHTVRDRGRHHIGYGGTESPNGPWVPSNSRDRADRRDLQGYFEQDRDAISEQEKPKFAHRERKRSFDDRFSSSKGGSIMDGVYRGRDPRAPASSSTGDSKDPRDSFSSGQGRAQDHTYPSPGEALGQDPNRDTSFSSGDISAVIRKYHSTPRADGSELDGKSMLPDDRVEKPRRLSSTPLVIPYTTPASEFLYGTSVVVAALRASKRRLYKLYIHDGDHREAVARDKFVQKLALSRQVPVTREKWPSMMDKMSGGRAHNGYVLEASPMPKLPVRSFQPVRRHQSSFHVVLDHQTREEEAVNGTDPEVKYESASPRYPFILMLDGILDPGNLGGILRTAYFFGVDAVAISNRNGAPLSPVALKASAGASEVMELMSIAHPRAYIDESQKNGWMFYAGVAPSGSTGYDRKGAARLTTATLRCPVRDHPCVLMLGGEGGGLPWDLQKKADFELGVEGYRAGQVGVDSLNVGVATGLLCEAFLREPVYYHTIKGQAETDNVERGERLF